MYVNKIDIINCINECKRYDGQARINKGDNMINNKEELIEKLKKNNGKIYINQSLLSINNITFYDDCNICMIYLDLDSIDTEDDLIEFCDSNGSIIVAVHLNDLYEFDQVVEYNYDGFISD